MLLLSIILLLSGCDIFFWDKKFSLEKPANSLEGLREQGLFCDRCFSGGNCSPKEVKQCNLIIIPARDNKLSLAITEANIERVRFLVNEMNANVNGRTGRINETPLTVAAYYGTKKHQEIAEFLISKGADVNDTGPLPNGRTPLLIAIWKNNVKFAKFLLEKKADPSLSGNGRKQDTACKFALVRGRVEMVSIIPECCALLKKEPGRLPEAVYKCL